MAGRGSIGAMAESANSGRRGASKGRAIIYFFEALLTVTGRYAALLGLFDIFQERVQKSDVLFGTAFEHFGQFDRIHSIRSIKELKRVQLADCPGDRAITVFFRHFQSPIVAFAVLLHRMPFVEPILIASLRLP